MDALTILGGGPAGLGVAFYAHRAGVPFVLLERSADLGGLCRTLRHGEHLFDCGAHRFHDRDPEITRDVVSLINGDMISVDTPSKVWDRGRFLDFPPTPINVLLACGIRDAGRIAIEVLHARRSRHEARTFEEFAIGQFGETLSRRILLNYSEKLWGLPASELSPDIATRRLQGMNLRSLIAELIMPGRKTTHIDGAFLYPRRGYGQIVAALAQTLPPDSLRTGAEVSRIDCNGGAITRIHVSGGASIDPPWRVVSTVPLNALVKLLGDTMPADAQQAAATLRFRSIRLIFLRIGRPRISPNASIYIPDPRFCVSRMYEPKNRSPAMAPESETSLVVEVPHFTGDRIAALSNDALADRVIRELAELTILDHSDVIEWRHEMLPNAYPVYSLDYKRRVAILLDAVGAVSNLDTTGRAGLFLYSHLHDQLRFGKDYVNSLLRSAAESPTRISAAD